MIRLYMLIKRNDVSAALLKWSIQVCTMTILDITRDVTEYLEILNQKQIQKIKRKKVYETEARY